MLGVPGVVYSPYIPGVVYSPYIPRWCISLPATRVGTSHAARVGTSHAARVGMYVSVPWWVCTSLYHGGYVPPWV